MPAHNAEGSADGVDVVMVAGISHRNYTKLYELAIATLPKDTVKVGGVSNTADPVNVTQHQPNTHTKRASFRNATGH